MIFINYKTVSYLLDCYFIFIITVTRVFPKPQLHSAVALVVRNLSSAKPNHVSRRSGRVLCTAQRAMLMQSSTLRCGIFYTPYSSRARPRSAVQLDKTRCFALRNYFYCATDSVEYPSNLSKLIKSFSIVCVWHYLSVHISLHRITGPRPDASLQATTFLGKKIARFPRGTRVFHL